MEGHGWKPVTPENEGAVIANLDQRKAEALEYLRKCDGFFLVSLREDEAHGGFEILVTTCAQFSAENADQGYELMLMEAAERIAVMMFNGYPTDSESERM